MRCNIISKTQWFEESRFGMFIHWGLYSIPAGVWNGRKSHHGYSEWLQGAERVPRKDYQKLAKLFNPTEFDADEWVSEAKNAGMKYLLITTKHHDGFALWPSNVSEYNTRDATPFKRDILGELTRSCQYHDIKLGFYYSHWQDWEGGGGDICDTYMTNDEYVHPTQEEFENYWQKKCLPQIVELINNYNPAFFWFDSWGELTGNYITDKRQDELISLINKESPDCLINSRIRFNAPSENVDYLSMMDNIFPEEQLDKPWETSGTLNHSWAYHALDYAWKSTEQLLKYLISNTSYSGNYQLNVGPMANGKFQKAALKRLRDIGNWMFVNGDSIYGAEACPLKTPEWGRITMKKLPDSVRYYLHLFDYTPGTALLLQGLESAPTEARVLETGQNVKFEYTGDQTWLEIPVELKGVNLPVITLTIKKEL